MDTCLGCPDCVIDVPALVLAEHAENEIRKDFTPSERVAIGKAVEEELGKIERRGRPKAESSEQGELIEEGEIPDNYPELSGQESREIAAKKAGFGSEFTYRDAKTVTEKATPELIEEGEISRNLDEFPKGRTDEIATDKARSTGSLWKPLSRLPIRWNST